MAELSAVLAFHPGKRYVKEVSQLPVLPPFAEHCEQATKETGSTKLLALTQGINRLFDECEKANRPPDKREPMT
jgi:hypothetical protein